MAAALHRRCFALVGLAVLLVGFTHNGPGVLVAGSGSGRVDSTIYVPGMRFPIEAAPAWANSQVWGHGGSSGPGGGQCDAENYSYPWNDNFCESRTWDMPLCPTGTGHQGQDIRPPTCENSVHWAVAAESGTITSIGTYSVYLQADAGTRHRYLHMDPSSLLVVEGDRVERGERLGRVSNAFDGTPTTIHLHYDLFQTLDGVGGVYVPPFTSLVASYEELLGTSAEPCAVLPPEGGILDDSGRCFAQFGPSASWRVVADAGIDGGLRWTNGWDGARSNWARWWVFVSEDGMYRVEVNAPDAYAASTGAIYEVQHAGGLTELVVDLSTADGWVTLGDYGFDTETTQWVVVADNTGEDSATGPRIPADAVRLTRLDTDSGDAGPDVGPIDAGGDAAGDAGAPDAPSDAAGTDAAPDASADSGSVDAAEDVAPIDAAADVVGDAAVDAARDAVSDSGSAPDAHADPISVRPGCSAAPGASAPLSALLFTALLFTALAALRARRRLRSAA